MKSAESGGSKRLGQSLSRQCKFGAGRAHAPGMRDMRGALGAPAAPPRRAPSPSTPGRPSGPRWAMSEQRADQGGGAGASRAQTEASPSHDVPV